MYDTAIKNFCIWARNELIQQVRQQALRYGITEEGYGEASAEIIEGRVLSNEEKQERTKLIETYLGKVNESYLERYSDLIVRAAYTWFNRFIAIRFMEVNGRLFSRVRMFSDVEDNFAPQVLKEALEVEIEGVDRTKVADLLDAGDDEALFRYLFLAQCDELAGCMPEVFEPIGSALELLLPQHLLRHGGVLERMVTDIPEEDWREGVQIVGWMYQYYNAERKDEVFASFKKGKKADARAIAPATQLFTPDWIVRYLTENSLGRLWMQGHPKSHLADHMPYYIADEEEATDAPSALTSSCENQSPDSSITSPEEIAVCDPACGSGHILVYAFDLLAHMYEEAGYPTHEIPQLILQKNLTGIEIDSRAAAMASFALSMKACEYDRRFLSRGVFPQVHVLMPVSFEDEELQLVSELADRTRLLDAMAHATECGSLFQPDSIDMIAIEDALAKLCNASNLFADSARRKVEQIKKNCEPLAKTYDCVVANPPYMGSKNMDKWLSSWVGKNYPSTKGDLFSCFIERNLAFANNGGQLGFMTPYVWMFIKTYEPLRKMIIGQAIITSLIQLEYSGFAGATVPICTFTLQKGSLPNYHGGYVRLSDFVGADNQAPKALEAIANHDCGWFYRRSADAFSAIPGTPIAYWVPSSMHESFRNLAKVRDLGSTTKGVVTADNDSFLRLWWECSSEKESFHAKSYLECFEGKARWFPISKGGQFRKWYGNNEYVVDWANGGENIFSAAKKTGKHPQDYADELKFIPGITWSAISSSYASFRYIENQLCESKGLGLFPISGGVELLLGACNSHVVREMLKVLAPTLDFNAGTIDLISVPERGSKAISELVKSSICESHCDWDAFETSWDFKRHPMV